MDRVPALSARVFLPLQKRFMHQVCEDGQRRTGDGGRRGAGEAALKQRQLTEHLPLLIIQQPPRPVKDSAHTALSWGQVAPLNAQKLDALFDFCRNCGQRQTADIGGCQFQAQWHPLHQLTNTQHRG